MHNFNLNVNAGSHEKDFRWISRDDAGLMFKSGMTYDAHPEKRKD